MLSSIRRRNHSRSDAGSGNLNDQASKPSATNRQATNAAAVTTGKPILDRAPRQPRLMRMQAGNQSRLSPKHVSLRQIAIKPRRGLSTKEEFRAGQNRVDHRRRSGHGPGGRRGLGGAGRRKGHSGGLAGRRRHPQPRRHQCRNRPPDCGILVLRPVLYRGGQGLGGRGPRPARKTGCAHQQRRHHRPGAPAQRRWLRNALGHLPPRPLHAHQPAARTSAGQRRRTHRPHHFGRLPRRPGAGL